MPCSRNSLDVAKQNGQTNLVPISGRVPVLNLEFAQGSAYGGKSAKRPPWKWWILRWIFAVVFLVANCQGPKNHAFGKPWPCLFLSDQLFHMNLHHSRTQTASLTPTQSPNSHHFRLHKAAIAVRRMQTQSRASDLYLGIARIQGTDLPKQLPRTLPDSPFPPDSTQRPLLV